MVTKQMLVSIVVTKGQEIPKPSLDDLINKLGSGTQIGDYTITSLSLIKSLDFSGGYKEHDEMEVLSGKDTYEEKLCGLTFHVGACAFF